MVVHTYNPSYLGSRGSRVQDKPRQRYSQDAIVQKQKKKNEGSGGIAQVVEHLP
jgi:hypothetical protein